MATGTVQAVRYRSNFPACGTHRSGRFYRCIPATGAIENPGWVECCPEFWIYDVDSSVDLVVQARFLCESQNAVTVEFSNFQGDLHFMLTQCKRSLVATFLVKIEEPRDIDSQKAATSDDQRMT